MASNALLRYLPLAEPSPDQRTSLKDLFLELDSASLYKLAHYEDGSELELTATVVSGEPQHGSNKILAPLRYSQLEVWGEVYAKPWIRLPPMSGMSGNTVAFFLGDTIPIVIGVEPPAD